LSSQRQTIEETITELEEQGGDYQELAGDLQAIKNGDHVENPVERYDTLLLSDRNARLATQQVLRQADSSVSDDYHERFQQLFTSNETAAFPIDTVEDTVTLDPDGRELRIERRFDDGSISPYQTIVELEVSFDPKGTVNQRTASFYETKKNTDARYDLGSLEFDDLDDIGLEAVQEAAREQLDEILSTRHLEAPEPVSDRDFLDRNTEAIGLYSIMYQDPEEMPLIFDRGTLDDFRSRLIQEAEWTIESPYQPVDEKKEALREIDEFRSIEDDAWELYGQMQHNKLESLRQKGEEERARDLIAEAFPTETEQMEAYARKLYFLFEEHVQDQSERLEGLTEIASDRIQQEEGFPQLSVEEVAGLLEETVQTR
ncbi:MAG: hypothetical protein SVU32_03535, partial [Candidatus Nanohaloarchaea archaeon]|nr:hypothetical protein [Candidatus Nanohaloarchaea archaeon]